MPRLRPVRTFVSLALLAATAAEVLHAQPAASPPRAAVAVGWSPAAGLVGGKYVRRPTAATGRRPVGFAVGVGPLGAGGRVHVGLGRGARNPGARRVPYAGVGAGVAF